MRHFWLGWWRLWPYIAIFLTVSLVFATCAYRFTVDVEKAEQHDKERKRREDAAHRVNRCRHLRIYLDVCAQEQEKCIEQKVEYRELECPP